MTKRRIAVVYDTSYLVREAPSLKQFVEARRFTSHEDPGLLGSLVSAVSGTKREKTASHAAAEFLEVVEVVPTEVLAELDHQSGQEKEKALVAGLLKGGATQIQLGTDTSVAGAGLDPAHAGMEEGRVLNQVLLR